MFTIATKTQHKKSLKSIQNWLSTILCTFFMLTSAAGHTQDLAPEPSTATIHKQAANHKTQMVVTAHPLASKAALGALNKGGSAIDAAIAAQMVLNLVEPQSSGIGGGGFLLFYDAKTKTITSFDGRETAPKNSLPDMFLDTQGKPIPFMSAVKSGKAIGTPGLLAMLAKTHQLHGKLAWKTLFTPAIKLAENGFSISPRLHKNIAYAVQQPTSRAFKELYLTASNQPKPVGETLKNLQLAQSFKNIAEHNIRAFYHGTLAKRIAEAAQEHGGYLTVTDLKNYKPKTRSTICRPYRDHNICSIGLPSSGGITLLQTLGTLASFNLNTPYSLEEVHLILEAEKHSFADRNHYLADRDFAKIPSINALLSSAYLENRAAHISQQKTAPAPASPGIFDIPNNGSDHSFDAPSTTHISIVDAAGNAVSLTSSVEHSFGSGIMVDGFVLNNQLTDFSFIPQEDGKPVANAVAPNKRPRSSMTPVIILKPNGSLHALIGSPGGSSIIGYVRKTVIALLDWHMPLQAALDAPHFMHKNRVAEIEQGNFPLANALESLGHEVTQREFSSGVHAIIVNDNGTLTGAADSRREGQALGN